MEDDPWEGRSSLPRRTDGGDGGPQQRPKWYCDLCAQEFESSEQKAQHLSGKKHVVMRERGKRFQKPVFKGEELHRWNQARKFLRSERKRADTLYRLQEGQLTQLQYLEEKMLVWEDMDALAEKKEVDPYPGYIAPELKEVLLEKIYATLDAHGVTKEQVLNIYRWGSQWWGTPTPRSDYDFLIIVKDWDQPAENNVVEGEDLDMALYEVNVFQQMLYRHVLWAYVFYSHSFENDGLWLERHRFKESFSKLKWYTAALHDLKKNYSLAQQYWNHGEIKKAKKRLIYILRHSDFAIQISKTRRVSNRFACNDVLGDFIARNFPTWQDVERWYLPMYEQRKALLKKETLSYREFEEEHLERTKGVQDEQRLATVGFLNRYGMEELRSNLGVRERQHSRFRELVIVQKDPVESPVDSLIIFECNWGMILERRDDEGKDGRTRASWRAIGAGPHPVRRHYLDKDRNIAENQEWEKKARRATGIGKEGDIDWASARVYEKLDGIPALLYHYKGEWLVLISKIPYKATEQELEKVFWNLWAGQGMGELSQLNTQLCYNFQLLVPEYRNIVFHPAARLVLIGARDVASPTLEEVTLEAAAKGHDAWPLAAEFGSEFECTLESVSREARLRHPAEFKGFIVCDKDFHRLAIHSPQYEQIVRLKALDRWEKEGEWDTEEEREDGIVYRQREGEGDLNYFEEREKGLLELLISYLQMVFATEESRNRKCDKGKWKKQRRERKTNEDAKDKGPGGTEDGAHEELDREKMNQQLIAEESPLDELFLKHFPEYAQGYMEIRRKFDALGKEVYERLNELKASHPTLREFAKRAEKDKHKSILFILYKRQYVSVRAFYADYECVHEWKIEKVALALYDWIKAMQKTAQEKGVNEKQAANDATGEKTK